MAIPKFFPPYGWAGANRLTMLRTSASGDIWALNYGGVRDSRPTWTVYSPDGRGTRQITSRDIVDVLDENGEVAIVLHWDANDVESIEARRLRW
jgi:hypothetical protein